MRHYIVNEKIVEITTSQQPTWTQIADFLRAMGEIFVALSVLIQIGQIIYEVFVLQLY